MHTSKHVHIICILFKKSIKLHSNSMRLLCINEKFIFNSNIAILFSLLLGFICNIRLCEIIILLSLFSFFDVVWLRKLIQFQFRIIYSNQKYITSNRFFSLSYFFCFNI